MIENKTFYWRLCGVKLDSVAGVNIFIKNKQRKPFARSCHKTKKTKYALSAKHYKIQRRYDSRKRYFAWKVVIIFSSSFPSPLRYSLIASLIIQYLVIVKNKGFATCGRLMKPYVERSSILISSIGLPAFSFLRKLNISFSDTLLLLFSA